MSAPRSSKTIEVETRFHFANREEAFSLLPFFQPCFTRSNRWHTVQFGHELFRKDVLLRIGESIQADGTRCFLGWKGPDTGTFANLRAELDEEITKGICHSKILADLGGRPDAESVTSVIAELHRLGHEPFMEFSGENQYGCYKPLNLQLKLSFCPILKWPWLLEIEQTACNSEQALIMEQELLDFTRQHHLEERVVQDEPTDLLYQLCFGHGTGTRP
ncbi:MAG TPA: hypothetical protein VEC37_02945 [Bacillota bacterium]|nr:hypothetical protein [Bacillota bacterium]